MVLLEGYNEQKAYTLDGGFSTQIFRHVGTTSDGDPLWSTRLLKTRPEEVVKTHQDFLRAGADIISTNTYQASIMGFVKHLGVGTAEAYELIVRATGLAQRARDQYNKERRDASLPERKTFVAGSVGPYGAHLLDGSEYTGTYAEYATESTYLDWHKPRMESLVLGGVDVLALETIPCQKEAEVLVQMLKEYPSVKAWLTFSCRDDRSLANGENFKKAARKCFELNPDQLLGIGVNCCSPKIVANLIRDINKDKLPIIPLVTYPNSGEKYDLEMGWVGKERCESLHTFVGEWLELGVRYVGGCCRTYAEDISRIHNVVKNWNDKKLN